MQVLKNSHKYTFSFLFTQRTHSFLPATDAEKSEEKFVYLTNNPFLCNRFRAIAVRTHREKPGMLRCNDNNLIINEQWIY